MSKGLTTAEYFAPILHEPKKQIPGTGREKSPEISQRVS